MPLRIGFARQTVTPSLSQPVYMAGFAQNRLAQSVHDDLWVCALALEVGQKRVVLAALDLVGLPRVHVLEIERRLTERMPGTGLLLACTHNHDGPDTIGLWGPDHATPGTDPQYLAWLKERVLESLLAALERMQPAQMRATATHVAGVARNARDPHIVDDELTCLQFCHPQDGATLLTLLVFPCHPELLWEHNQAISADYVGFVRRQVEEQTGAPCLFLVGALGGMMTPATDEHTFEEAARMGATLARAGPTALAPTPCLEVHHLEHLRREVSVPMTNPLFQMALAAGLLPGETASEGEVTTEINLLKVGPAWFAGVPGELLPKLGLEVKALLRQAGAEVAGVIGLVNDEVGYILPPEEFVYPDDPFQPGSHYEETMSLGPETAPRLLTALKEVANA
jgi:hypothetical protein